MDSPLSRSPGSSVLIGVGLPITRASSRLGGPHRLEYWGTPPQSRSFPLVFTPPPPPPLHWPTVWDWVAPPIRFWLVPGLACQLVVFAPSDWPCAKKRLMSSSPANSARMVVFPSTHLRGRKKNKNQMKCWKEHEIIHTQQNLFCVFYFYDLLRDALTSFPAMVNKTGSWLFGFQDYKQDSRVTETSSLNLSVITPDSSMTSLFLHVTVQV